MARCYLKSQTFLKANNKLTSKQLIAESKLLQGPLATGCCASEKRHWRSVTLWTSLHPLL